MRTALLYNFLIEANIMASIAILLMMLLRKFLRRPLGNGALCFGWLLVAMRLLLPLSLPNPLINGIRSPFAMDIAIRPIAGQVKVRLHDFLIDFSVRQWGLNNKALGDRAFAVLESIESAQLTVRLAQIENSVYRLADAVKKTQKRSNALNNIMIPRLSETVKYITDALDEKEREDFSRLKVTKRTKEKKEK